eukprot:4791723-Heterocapsa_arctica.AAC.1
MCNDCQQANVQVVRQDSPHAVRDLRVQAADCREGLPTYNIIKSSKVEQIYSQMWSVKQG